jgi:glycosyltransferase involved in cell wall biosynthesis
VVISIVIATRNRSVLLNGTLRALALQQWPREQMEIIVADNGSTDDTRVVVDRASAAGLPVRYLYVAEPGKSYAVNAALRLTRGDVVAFTDDDVQPDRGWLEGLAQALNETGAAFVAGRILPIWEIDPPSWMSPSLYGVLAVPDNGAARLPITKDVPSQVMPIGANMAVRASVIARLGGMRTDLGKLEGSLRTGEDHEFFLRLLHGGCRGTYEPAALVRHLVPAARLYRGYFRRWLFQNGSDVARLERGYAAPVRVLLGVPRYLWRQTIRDAASALRAALAGNRAQQFASALRIIWFSGYLREAWFGRSGTTPPAWHLAQEQ